MSVINFSLEIPMISLDVALNDHATMCLTWHMQELE